VTSVRRSAFAAVLAMTGGLLAPTAAGASAHAAAQAVPAGAVAPDSRTRVAVDAPDGRLRFTDVATSRLVRTIPLPGGPSVFHSGEAFDQVSWSPNGRTIAVVRGYDEDEDDDYTETSLVTVSTGLATLPVFADGGGTSTWATDGSALYSYADFLDNGNLITRSSRISLDGTVTTVAAIPTTGPAPDLGGPVQPVTDVTAAPSGAGTVTVTATVPAADVAGAWIRDSAGHPLTWLPATGAAKVTGLRPSETYRLQVVGEAWSGSAAAPQVVTVRTTSVPGTAVRLSAPASSSYGKTYPATVLVRRSDTGKPAAGRTVLLEGNGKTLARGKTDAHGRIVFHPRGADDTRLQAIVVGDSHAGGSSSNVVLVRAAPAVRVVGRYRVGARVGLVLRAVPSTVQIFVQIAGGHHHLSVTLDDTRKSVPVLLPAATRGHVTYVLTPRPTPGRP
jgi:hypothetical protein